jgi:Protein of unknown function (DUF3363)
MVGRMQKLERLGLADPLGPARCHLSENAEPVMRGAGRAQRNYSASTVDWPTSASNAASPSSHSIRGTLFGRYAQVHADRATWFDRQLVGRGPPSLSSDDFGRQERDAMEFRIEHLFEQGLPNVVNA